MAMSMAYCDYIAHTIIKPGLDKDSSHSNGLFVNVDRVKMDLHKEGWMQTTTKTIECSDIHGKSYRITVEEI